MVEEWLQNELAVSFHVSLQCVSCELKFFTGHLERGHLVENAKDTWLPDLAVA